MTAAFIRRFLVPAVADQSIASRLVALKHSKSLNDAGLVAGVFFGRLTRRFGSAAEPSNQRAKCRIH